MRHRLRPPLRHQAGMTMIELLIVIVVLGILLTVAVAGLSRARVSSNEASAIAGLRAIYSAQFSYTAGCGSGGYATTLGELSRIPPGGGQGYLALELAGSEIPERNGYRFSLGPGNGGVAGPPDCHGAATQTRYYASTVPVVPVTTGTRSFAITQAGSIWQAQGAAPPAEPFGPPSQVVR